MEHPWQGTTDLQAFLPKVMSVAVGGTEVLSLPLLRVSLGVL